MSLPLRAILRAATGEAGYQSKACSAFQFLRPKNIGG
jgi:hypothetical protein